MTANVETTMQTFSFRAECSADVQRFFELLSASGIVCAGDVDAVQAELPDVEVELQADATEEQLRVLLRQVEDGHVMLQTLRPVPLDENSLDRDYDAN